MAEPLPENTDKKREESKSAFNQTKKTPNHKHLKELRNQNSIKPLSTATLNVKQVPTFSKPHITEATTTLIPEIFSTSASLALSPSFKPKFFTKNIPSIIRDRNTQKTRMKKQIYHSHTTTQISIIRTKIIFFNQKSPPKNASRTDSVTLQESDEEPTAKPQTVTSVHIKSVFQEKVEDSSYTKTENMNPQTQNKWNKFLINIINYLNYVMLLCKSFLL